jgi:hypothetical protein
VLSGRLASPKPPSGGEPKERGNETHETESLSDLEGQVALAAVKGEKTVAELTEQFRAHPTQITDWKQQLLVRAADVVGGSHPPSDTPDLKMLHAKIRHLTLGNDVLEGALTKAGLRSATR